MGVPGTATAGPAAGGGGSCGGGCRRRRRPTWGAEADTTRAGRVSDGCAAAARLDGARGRSSAADDDDAEHDAGGGRCGPSAAAAAAADDDVELNACCLWLVHCSGTSSGWAYGEAPRVGGARGGARHDDGGALQAAAGLDADVAALPLCCCCRSRTRCACSCTPEDGGGGRRDCLAGRVCTTRNALAVCKASGISGLGR